MKSDQKIECILEDFMKEAQKRLEQYMDKEAQHYIGYLVVKGVIESPEPNKGFAVDPNDFCKLLKRFYCEYIKMMKLWQRVDQVLTPLSKVVVMPKDDITQSTEKPVIVN